MKKFRVATGNGSYYDYVAEYMETGNGFIHFMVDGKIVGMKSLYGVVSISDQPYNQRYV